MIPNRYTRNIGTLTVDEQALLGGKRVFIAGCGGLGGHLIAHMLRIGVGHMTAIDGDVFDESNLNRQLLSSVDVIGRSKAEVAAEYASCVNPSVSFQALPVMLNEENALSLISGHDLVLDALDNIESRRILAKACDELQIPYIYGAICGFVSQVGTFPPGTAEKRLSVLYPPKAALTDKSCIAPTPSLCASLQATEAIKWLTGKGDCLTGSILYADLLQMEFYEIPI